MWLIVYQKSANVMSTASTNFHKMDYYILHIVLLVTMLFIIHIICYHYKKDRPKLKKTYCHVNNIKMENNRFKVCIKNRMCFKNFDDIITFEDFDFDNTLIAEKF